MLGFEKYAVTRLFFLYFEKNYCMLCMYNVYMRMQAIGIHVYSLGKNFAELVLSSHIYVSSRYETYVSRL